MSDYFERVERQIARRVQEGVPRRSRLRMSAGHLALVAAVAVVVLVAGVFLAARGGSSPAPTRPSAPHGVSITFTASPTATGAQLQRTVEILRARLSGVVPRAHVSPIRGRIVVTVPDGTPRDRAQIGALSRPGRLAFYDWEGDVIAPNGKTVASQLPSPDPTVLGISQGNGSVAPGQLGAGCVPLQQALALVARVGAGRPRRLEYLGAQTVSVPAGYTLLQATGSGQGHGGAGYYVLKSRPALSGGEITNPKQSSDPNTGAPDVTFGFTARGAKAFQSVTAAIARRGSEVSSLGDTLNQHFAVALDNQLISVPSIDFKVYPDGISGEAGADLSGNFGTVSAKHLAILLRYGPLPLHLTAAG